MKAKGLMGALLGGAVAAAALLGACSQAVNSPGPEPEPAATGTVAVSLALAGNPASGGAARTVFPDTSAITKYVLAFAPTVAGETKSVELEPPAATANVTLVEGTYNLTVTAKKGDTEVAVGTAAGLVISSSQAATASVSLGPKPGGADGAFSYTITVPAGASGSLSITTSTGGTVSDGTKTLTAGANTGTVNLAPGDYRLAVSLVKDTKTAGFNNEVVYSYSGLTSAFTRTFTDEHFAGAEPDPDPETGSLGLTISFGAETILLSESGPLSFEEGAATTFTLAVTGAGFSDINWYLDEDTNPVASGAAYTPANDLEVKIHSVTVRAEKGGKPYSEIVDFTVTAAAGSAQQTVGPVSATGLAGALASLTTDATPEAPHTVILAGFDVTGSAWGGTVKAALTGNTKYIILDLTACTTSGNNYTLSGGSSPTGNHFNIIRGYNVVGVILPSDLTEIGNNALNRWTSLRYVTITSNLITIGGNSFAETTSLKTITIPNSVTTIVGGAFQDGGLESIAIPDSVTSLEAGTFSPCPDLTEVTFGGTGMTIENDTFEGNLHTVYTGAGTYAKTSGTGSGSVWAKD